MVIRVGRVGRM